MACLNCDKLIPRFVLRTCTRAVRVSGHLVITLRAGSSGYEPVLFDGGFGGFSMDLSLHAVPGGAAGDENKYIDINRSGNPGVGAWRHAGLTRL